MGVPLNPITLTTEEIEELLSKLSKVRHNINNNLAMVVAATELIKVNSEMVPRMTNTLMEQPPKIAEELSRFSAEIDRILRIART